MGMVYDLLRVHQVRSKQEAVIIWVRMRDNANDRLGVNKSAGMQRGYGQPAIASLCGQRPSSGQ